MLKINKLIPLLIVFVIANFFLLFYFKNNTSGYLSFSDAAKFADMAKNIIKGSGYFSSFSFGVKSVFSSDHSFFPSPWIPPLMPYSIAIFYKIMGISDLTVIFVSASYFLILIQFVYLLAEKLFGKFVGLLSAIIMAANIDFLNYATNGSTETLFSLEIIAAAFFIAFKKKQYDLIALVLLILSYFTRPQAFIYIAGLILYWLLLNFKLKKAFIYFCSVVIIGFLVDYFILSWLAGRYFLYSVTTRGLGSAAQVAAGGSPSDSLRGAVSGGLLISDLFKKTFYNLYNFYKLLPRIMNPYLFTLFFVGLSRHHNGIEKNAFRFAVVFMTLLTLLVTAMSIPFFRYLHPVTPLIIILAVDMLVWSVEKVGSEWKLLYGDKNTKRNKPLSLLNAQNLIISTSLILVLFFAVGQTLGVIFLDSRYEKHTHNYGKPPVYALLSWKLKDNTDQEDIIVTNLDTWGSWYGERKTVWFPLVPSQLINTQNESIPFDAIYLTNYLMDDQNYYMGDSWRQIFNLPLDPSLWNCAKCSEIADEFEVKDVYQIPATDNFENLSAYAVLFVKRN